MTSEKARENRLRRWAARLGIALHKDRARTWAMSRQGGYMVSDIETTALLDGEHYELSLDDVEAFLTEREAALRAELAKVRGKQS